VKDPINARQGRQIFDDIVQDEREPAVRGQPLDVLAAARD
jgi:hypothetical protein